jgi:hypothetical protein
MQHPTISKILLSYSSYKEISEIHSLGPTLWISNDWEYRCASVGHRYLKKGSGVDQKTSQYLV